MSEEKQAVIGMQDRVTFLINYGDRLKIDLFAYMNEITNLSVLAAQEGKSLEFTFTEFGEFIDCIVANLNFIDGVVEYLKYVEELKSSLNLAVINDLNILTKVNAVMSNHGYRKELDDSNGDEK